MKRSRRNSRILIIVLALVVVAGLAIYFKSPRHTDAAPQEPTAATHAPAVAASADTTQTPPAPVNHDSPPARNDQAANSGALVTTTPTAAVAAPLASAVTPAAPALASASNGPTAPQTAAPATPTEPIVPADQAIAQGKAMIDSGDLVGGRAVLNSALISAQLSASDQTIAKEMIASANQTLLLSSRFFADDPWQEQYTVQSGDVMVRIANRYFIPYELISKINNNLAPNRIRPGQKLKVLKGPMHAVIHKNAYTLDIYLGAPGGEGSMYVCSFRVGLGAENSTPTGLWVVPKGAKVRNPTYYSSRGEGIIAADDPKNPLGEHWIAIDGLEGEAVGKTSYGIHGTIEPETIGTQASQGCVRLRNEDVEQVFEMLYEVKSTVRIVD